MIKLLATGFRPVEQFDGAVNGGAFLIPRDKKAERSAKIRADFVEKLEDCGDGSCNAALHVGGTTAKKDAIDDVAIERSMTPAGFITSRHNISVTGEQQIRL